MPEIGKHQVNFLVVHKENTNNPIAYYTGNLNIGKYFPKTNIRIDY